VAVTVDTVVDDAVDAVDAVDNAVVLFIFLNY
jgi:hypothetical protein